MSDSVFGNAESDAVRAELISAMVQRALREQGKLIPTVRDVSNLAQPGLDKILFPKRGSSFEVQNLVEDSEADVQSFTYSNDELALNQHAIISWFIKKRADLQSVVDIESDAIAEAAAEHAIDVDRKIIAALLAGASSDNDVSVTGAITQAKLLEMKKELQIATKLNPRNAVFNLLVGSAREAELLAISAFVSAEQYGSAIVPNGALGRLYNINVYVTDEPQLPSTKSMMYVQNGLVYGNQMQPDFRELYIPKRAGTEYALDMVYGVKVLDSGKYISVLTHS